MPKYKLTTVQHVCETCNSTFFPSLSNFTKGRCRFCCRECYRLGIKVPLANRFKRHISQPDANGCILWTSTRHRDGYGMIHVKTGKRMALAHRVAYELANGPVPEGMFVCHTCDNRLCVNPSHLFVGTHRENMDDMFSKNREARGEKLPQSKLSESSVISIRTEFANGSTCTELGRKHCVSHSSITNVIRRVTWKHVP